MAKKYNNDRVFVYSCPHLPYQHPDILPYFKAVKEEYAPDRIISVGDDWDNHAISFHASDPDLFSASHEMKIARKVTKQIEEIFPKIDIMKSNHGSLVSRRVIAAGLPRGLIKSYNQIYEVGKGWKWHLDLTITLPTGQQLYLTHMKRANALNLSKNVSMNVVQGHYHSQCSIQYWSNPKDLYWSMQLPCLFDAKSRAFAYNKTDANRPIIGAGIIIDGFPRLLPLIKKRSGRWSGKLV